ncbi:S-adenosyl-L-methionine-dependent methyltransferase [Glomus cerebriforme]|uniref:Protein-lysine N-methyltransferase EFM4 n=1 Tax=Glomus cerebriforme TaxID=658196 RepID=A0A397SS33_9GLOM|nr:S-adenosyl-L-methionine-dependent methyltransferase [Glomus cerebriforme]
MSKENNIFEYGPSELGTKEYWDSLYDRENKNFQENGDIGEIWFGEHSVEKMVDWVLENVSSSSITILDIGCGNGNLLLELASNNFTNLIGIDYSPNAIKLANDIVKQRNLDNIISYYVIDLINSSITESNNEFWLNGTRKFDIILDKGTFDAIALYPKEEEKGKHSKDIYSSKVHSLLNINGYFLITSCNFTKEELIIKFNDEFDYFDHIKYPTFSFGGVKGQTISTVAFKPKKK